MTRFEVSHECNRRAPPLSFIQSAVLPQRSPRSTSDPTSSGSPKPVDAIVLSIRTHRYTHLDGLSGFSPICYHPHHLSSFMLRRLFYLLLEHCWMGRAS